MRQLVVFFIMMCFLSCRNGNSQVVPSKESQENIELKDSPLKPNYFAEDTNPYAFYESADKFIDAVMLKQGYWGKTVQAEVYARRFVEKQKDDAEVIKLMKWLPHYIGWHEWRNLYINKVSATVRAEFDTVQMKKWWGQTEFTYRDRVLKRGVNSELVEMGKQAVDADIAWEKKVEEENIFVHDEEMPEFPGGMDRLIEYIKTNVRLPECVRHGDVQGKSIIEFVVEVDGELEDFRVVRSLNKECDNEAIRVLTSMPRWRPGRLRGRPVKIKYVVPVQFKKDVSH